MATLLNPAQFENKDNYNIVLIVQGVCGNSADYVAMSFIATNKFGDVSTGDI